MSKKNRDKFPKTEMEYEDAPSGYVTLYNYKEPYTPFEGGFGFEGALLFDGDTDKVQCHICGEWFEHLVPHIKLHGLNAKTYKREVGLAQTTALISEKTREKLVASGLEKRMKNLRNRKGIKHTTATKRKIALALSANPTEHKNRRSEGTCPMQLIDRLKKLAIKLGRPPIRDEIGFIDPLVLTFGTYKEACQVAGLEYRKSGQTVHNQMKAKYKPQNTIKFVKDYYIKTGKLPTRQAFKIMKRLPLWEFYRKNKVDINKLALQGDGLYKDIGERTKYSRQELLDFLVSFKKYHNRRPSVSDSKRGLLPPFQRYYYNFGNWKGALDAAFGEENEIKTSEKTGLQKLWQRVAG